MIRSAQFKKPTQWILGLLAFVLLTGSALAEIQVGLKLSKNPIPLGESSTLSITVSGTRKATPPTLQSNDMLDIAYRGASTSQSIINGAVSTEIKFNYVLQPRKLGKYRIPPISLTANGETYTSEPLVIEIVKGAPAVLDVSLIAQLDYILPDRPLYVGETFPSQLRMSMLSNANFTNLGLPVAEGDAFSLSQLDAQNYTTSKTIIDGQYWDVFTWQLGITPVKSGVELLEYTTTHTIRIRDRSSSQQGSNLFSNDPFFRAAFGNYTEKQVTSKTNSEPITVLSLPTEGAPEEFSGAIGQFSFEVTALNTDLKEGDPVTLSITIQGEGNFSQMTPPQFLAGDNFKSYPPIVKEENYDELKFKGSKVFEYIVIPRKADITEIPAIPFTFFNPVTQTYQTNLSKPIPLNISPAATIASNQPIVNHLQTSIQPRAQIDPNQLLPIKIALSDLTTRPTDDRITKTLTASVVSPIILLSLFSLIRRGRESSRKDFEKCRLKMLDQKMSLHKAEMRKARQNNNTIEFYEASCRILQAALAKQLGCNPDAITGKEIDALWVPSLGSNATKETIHTFFGKVDALRYSGSAIEPGVLASEEKEIETILSTLGKKR